MQKSHYILHHVLVVDDRLLESNDLLQQHGMVYAELIIAIL